VPPVLAISNMTGKIFINYRRIDAEAWADRLFERLKEQLPDADAVMDINGNIPFGLPWVDWIASQVAACDLMLVLIGRNWAAEFHARSSLGERDYVCVEIETALSRKIPVVPVLLGDASIPSAANLPEAIRPLLNLQAARLQRTSFESDVKTLIDGIARSIRIVRGEVSPPQQSFAQLFAERLDVISEVETEAGRAPAELVAEFERFIVRLEIHVCEPRPPSWTSPEDQAHRQRLLALVGQKDGGCEEAKAFVAVSHKCDERFAPYLQATNEQRHSMHSISEQEHQSGYREWREKLDSYQRAIGDTASIRNSIGPLGTPVAPLVCLAYRRCGFSDAHNTSCNGYAYTWRMELELAKVMCRLRDYRALPFLAESIVRHEDSMNGHDDFGLGIVHAIRSFGAPRETVDACFERLVGITASDILREKRDREKN
jgi:hypothetical protein